MAKFVYLYTGGQMSSTPEGREQAMQAWGAWFGGLGSAVVEIGNPFGESATVKSGGTVPGAASGASGFSVIEAGSLEEATARVAGCPVLDGGGTVEVFEAIPM